VRQNRRYIIYALMFLLLAINYMDRSVLSVAAKPISADFHLSVSSLGIVFSVFSWTYIVCLLPAGFLADRVGPKKTAAFAIVLWSLATLLTGLAGSVGILIVIRLVMGAGEAGAYPSLGRVSLDWIAERERGRVTAIYNSGSYAGPALGSLISVALIANYSWHAAFYVMGAVGFVWLALWLWLYARPERARWLAPEERDHILAGRRATASTVKLPPPSGADLLRLLAHNRTMWVLVLTQGCAVYTQYLFLTFLPSYLESSHHLSVFTGGIESAVPYFVAVAGGIGLGIFSDRLLRGRDVSTGRRRYMVAASLLISAIVLVTPFVNSVVVVLILVSISLTFVATSITLTIALGVDLLHDHRLTGQVQALIPIGGNAFGLLAPIVTGFVVQHSGSYDTAFVVAGILLIAGSILAVAGARTPIGEVPAAAGRQEMTWSA
jgi:MFS family permease